ncbi:MAG: P-loop NTPase fold protein [Gemmatimonadaceae bacterium]
MAAVPPNSDQAAPTSESPSASSGRAQPRKRVKRAPRSAPDVVQQRAGEVDDAPVFEDRYFEAPDGPLPDEVLPDPACVVVLDQGTEGVGVGFGLASVINYLRRERGSDVMPSPWMLYKNAQRYDEWPGVDYVGSSARGAMVGWWEHGVCDLNDWPGIASEAPVLSKEALDRAEAGKPTAFARVKTDVESLRAAVYHLHAVFVSVLTTSAWDDPRDGVIQSGGEIRGGHALAIVGYTRTGFILLNSWGEKWGGVQVGDAALGGTAILPYDDARTGLTDAWVARISGRILSRRAHRAGYRTDSVEGEIRASDDRLGILSEVRALGAVAAARDIEPPLSIGLFGDWGAGKSFFMRQLQRHISDIDKSARADPGSIFCSDIVQIRFNAWHYLDTNLWAGLVVQIFAGLLDQIRESEGDDQKRERLENELRDASQLLQSSQGALGAAEKQKDLAEAALDTRQNELVNARATLAGARDDLSKLFQQDPRLRPQLDTLAKAIGLPQVPASLSELKRNVLAISDLHDQIREAIARVFRHRGRVPRLIMLLLVGAALGVGFWILVDPARIADLRAAAVALQTALGFLVTATGSVIVKLHNIRDKANDLRALSERIDALHEQHVAELTKSERDDVQRKQSEVTAAARVVDVAQNRVAQLQQDIARLDPAEQLREFILTRGGSADYTKQLGIVTLVRQDFERLSDLLRRNEDARKAAIAAWNASAGGATERPSVPTLPVQRIILYIDDLDRCPPDRVVAVLEAVHLMLAFRIFVVVVAVDPRWLRRSLEKHYPDLLSPPERADEYAFDASRTSTPQDYLEKIFQIPLYLRPITADGYRGMIEQLAGADMEQEEELLTRTEGAQTQASAEKAVIDKSVGFGDVLEEDHGVSPAQLRFREWELRDMDRLAMLFRTPRAVKRFVNTYRLVRVMVRPTELSHFEGTRTEPGEYRWPMLLLAVVAGFPNVGLRFVLTLDRLVATNPSLSMSEFLRAAFPEPNAPPQTTKPGTERKSRNGNSAPMPAARDAFEGECARLRSAITKLNEIGFMPATPRAFRRWLPSVARFSFAPESAEAAQHSVEVVVKSPARPTKNARVGPTR